MFKACELALEHLAKQMHYTYSLYSLLTCDVFIMYLMYV